jgi:cell wall-associated NlpC family hydrolase
MLLLSLFLGIVSSITAQQEAILACLRAELGKPFILGANGPDAWDCSSLTRHCQEAGGITGLPRTSIEQSRVGKTIDCKKADVGDVNTEKPISEYPNVFTNTFWGPRIAWCKRHWNDDPAAPTPTLALTPGPTETEPATDTPAASPTLSASPTMRATAVILPGLSEQQSAILICLEKQLGKQSRPQGANPEEGFDASGLTQSASARLVLCWSTAQLCRRREERKLTARMPAPAI